MHDPAALFESTKAKLINYCANPNSSCLVEQDEEPPHELDADAKKIALIIASALKSQIYTEWHIMRKTVVDGSNTTGFQRTMLVSQGGSFSVPHASQNQTIKVQSVCLEEDAAKTLDAKKGSNDNIKRYGLERLGVPLVEIATEPFDVSDLGAVKATALSLGRILRSTRMVTRGLGSIRQDVNVSISQGRGAVIEVKGVQRLEQLSDVVLYEAHRQHGLLAISEKLQECKWSHNTSSDRVSVTEVLKNSASKIIQKTIRQKDNDVMAVAFRGAKGVFGYAPYENIRLGREIAELVRLFGIGGVFHSDELPAYGITEKDVENISKTLRIDHAGNDAFLMLAAPRSKIHTIIDQIISRVRQISTYGIPADTRLATADGKTVFLRPRPGAARMYPETDVPTVLITQEELDYAASSIPKPWDESVKDLQSKYGINSQLAGQLWDSARLELFEEIASAACNCSDTDDSKSGSQITSPTFVASVFCSTITNLERRQNGCDSRVLSNKIIRETFDCLNKKEIAKESIEIIFQKIMTGESKTVTDAIKSAAMQNISREDLEDAISKIIQGNAEMIKNQGMRAAGPLMGIVMKEFRGRAPGQAINALVVKGIAKVLESDAVK